VIFVLFAVIGLVYFILQRYMPSCSVEERIALLIYLPSCLKNIKRKLRKT